MQRARHEAAIEQHEAQCVEYEAAYRRRPLYLQVAAKEEEFRVNQLKLDKLCAQRDAAQADLDQLRTEKAGQCSDWEIKNG